MSIPSTVVTVTQVTESKKEPPPVFKSMGEQFYWTLKSEDAERPKNPPPPPFTIQNLDKKA